MRLMADEASKAAASSRRSWGSYLGIAFATAACMMALYGATLAGLAATGNLPPPAFVNSLCADAKLQHIRNNPPDHPTALIVGSSIAWRNFDSAAIVQQYPDARPLNAGVCGLRANQAEFVAGFFLKRYPSAKRVLLLLAPEDLLLCSRTDATLFDAGDVNAYLSRTDWNWLNYLKYFDPVSLIRNAANLRAKQENRIPLDPLVFTRYADGPLNTSESKGILYGRFALPDQTCLDAVHDLAKTVHDSGRQMLVATSPLSPEWVSRFDQDDVYRPEFTAAIRSSLDGAGAEFWNGAEQAAQPQAAFTDDIHMRWSGAERFSAALVQDTHFGMPAR